MDIETDVGKNRFVQGRLVRSAAGDGEVVMERDNAAVQMIADSSGSVVGRSNPLPPAVLPALLADLAEYCKREKDELAHADYPWQRALLDAKQKAFNLARCA